MKKVLLISFLILSLLVSCATKSATSVDEVSQEDVAAVVVDDFPSASVEQVTAVEIPVPISAIELASEETDIKESPMEAESPTAEMPEAESPEPVSDDSWMYAPIAEAPIDDVSASDASTADASVARGSVDDETSFEESAIAAVEGSSADEDVPAVVEGEAPMNGSVSSVESLDEVVAVASVESAVGQKASQAELQGRGEGQASVATSFVAKAVGFFRIIGRFIAEQTLLSIGLLVDLIGVVYLIIVLVRTGSRRKASRHGEAVDSDVDPSEAGDENTARHAELSDEEEFLRNLLGE